MGPARPRGSQPSTGEALGGGGRGPRFPPAPLSARRRWEARAARPGARLRETGAGGRALRGGGPGGERGLRPRWAAAPEGEESRCVCRLVSLATVSHGLPGFLLLFTWVIEPVAGSAAGERIRLGEDRNPLWKLSSVRPRSSAF